MTKDKGHWTKDKLLLALTLSTLSTTLPRIATATPLVQIDAKIITTGVLRIGIRENIPPLGQRQHNNWTGYCADIAEALAEHLSRHSPNPIQVLFITSTTQSRYPLVASGIVDLECGPNTINPEAETTYGVKFSVPFFVTATQILTRPEVEPSSLGVIKNTTNEADLHQIYPSNQINNTFSDYEQGINGVLFGSISGFASDGILLVGAARRLNLLTNQDYILLTPKTPAGNPFCAHYGMILPGSDREWRDQVNHFLTHHKDAITIWRRWFSHLDPSIQAISTACEQAISGFPPARE